MQEPTNINLEDFFKLTSHSLPHYLNNQESNEDSPSSNSIQVIHHVLKNVPKITAVDRVSFPKWMECMHYHNIKELCDDLQFELKYIHDCSDYIVNGQNCELYFLP